MVVGTHAVNWDLFALRVISPPPCTYIHCMGFNSLHGSPALPCTCIHCIHCMGSIPCVCDLLTLRVLSSPPCTYIHWVLLHGFNSLCGWPLCTNGTIPLPCTYIHCMGSIPCVGDLYALKALFPPPCTCIHCISLACVAIPCMGPQHSHVPTFTAFTVWVQFTMWLPLKVWEMRKLVYNMLHTKDTNCVLYIVPGAGVD